MNNATVIWVFFGDHEAEHIAVEPLRDPSSATLKLM
jgi:hypothetical protein